MIAESESVSSYLVQGEGRWRVSRPSPLAPLSSGARPIRRQSARKGELAPMWRAHIIERLRAPLHQDVEAVGAHLLGGGGGEGNDLALRHLRHRRDVLADLFRRECSAHAADEAAMEAEAVRAHGLGFDWGAAGRDLGLLESRVRDL